LTDGEVQIDDVIGICISIVIVWQVQIDDVIGVGFDGSVAVKNLSAEDGRNSPDVTADHFEHVVLQVLTSELDLCKKTHNVISYQGTNSGAKLNHNFGLEPKSSRL
jgi:hypothetical protein